ncbi:MAG: hypothetical protein ACK56F_30915, partial [bacterium]
HLGDRTQGISSLFPDPSRRTREPPSSGCISSRHSGSPLQFSKIQMARVSSARLLPLPHSNGCSGYP